MMLLLLAGLSIVAFWWGTALGQQLIPDPFWRRIVTILLSVSIGTILIRSPLGQVSGAHLNPAVSVAFWLVRKMRGRDIPFYILVQFLGAVTGTALAWLLWGKIAENLRLGITMPGMGFDEMIAFKWEFLLTALRLGIVFACVSSIRTARWTPYVLWVVSVIMIWFEAPISGASLNSARSFGPALVASYWKGFWIYLFAPNLAAIGVALLARYFLPIRQIVTAMLYHPNGPCPHPNCLICEAAAAQKCN